MAVSSLYWCKHVLIQQPTDSGSFFNYILSFSIVLLALVDTEYKFLYVYFGCNGRVADGGVFKNSTLFAALENNSLNVPSLKPIIEMHKPLSYMIVSDDAFPLTGYIQKSYSQVGLTKEKRIFNYRLSRAQRIVENVFGILSNRFQVFMAPEKVETTCCTLHNYLRSSQESQYVHINYHQKTGVMAEKPKGWKAMDKQGSNHCLD